MVVPNGIEDLWAEDGTQPACSRLRVAAHEPHLREVERSRLGDDPVRDPELSDVVEEAREARFGLFPRAQPDMASEVPRQVPHPDEMCPGTLVEMFPQLDGYYVSITRHN